MNREEWHKWKKSLDPNYIIPSKEEDDRMQREEESLSRQPRLLRQQEEQEAQRQREFGAFYNHT